MASRLQPLVQSLSTLIHSRRISRPETLVKPADRRGRRFARPVIRWQARIVQTGVILALLASAPSISQQRQHGDTSTDLPNFAVSGSAEVAQTTRLVSSTAGAFEPIALEDAGAAPSGQAISPADASPATSTDALTSPATSTDALSSTIPSASTTSTATPPGLPAAETAAPAPEASPSTPHHIVKEGDTIDGISAAYGVTKDTIARANGLADPNRIMIGQKLRIAEGDAKATPEKAPATSHEEFIQSLVPGAQESQRITGVPTSVTLAQAILETYWGSSFLAREANNYFGIKAYAKPGSAGVVWIDAWEVENGKDLERQEPFRKYADPGESLVDHGRFFLENSRYDDALKAANDPKEFARRINAAGYATDPAYASKLILYMDRYNLYQWDLAL